ncbi:hypothetical protein GCM10011390_09910 [Aureimonas endophytica]|uniref:Uncharacterized protein n=1 Tax=Aureimonas endophytica TaxID=2027858 RepID=A0A916ZFW9_9HYPH|nr:hypothetical protein GCM10011390_09910 [Aureimonas endophytica]
MTNGHLFLDELDKTRFRPDAALWVHDTDLDAWRLWVVPAVPKPDKHEFYRTVSTVLSRAGSRIDLSPSAVRLVPFDHPAIRALAAIYGGDRQGDLSLSSNMLNGFFIPDGIVIRMTDPTPRTTAA